MIKKKRNLAVYHAHVCGLVYLEAVVGPRTELEYAGLLVEGEVLDVDFAGGLVYRRRLPLDQALVVDGGLRGQGHLEVSVRAASEHISGSGRCGGPESLICTFFPVLFPPRAHSHSTWSPRPYPSYSHALPRRAPTFFLGERILFREINTIAELVCCSEISLCRVAFERKAALPLFFIIEFSAAGAQQSVEANGN